MRVPTREIRRLATRVDQGIGFYLKARTNRALDTKWEAPCHAWALSNLTVRHTEAVCLLARTDLVFLAPAWLAARAAIESAARAQWLMAPSDDWERECRWISLLREGAQLGERTEFGESNPFGDRSRSLASFSEAVAGLLPAGYQIPRKPKDTELVAGLGPGPARLYVLASQWAHSAELATGQFRAHLGTKAVYGEHVASTDWVMPLIMGWNAVRASSAALMPPQSDYDSDLLSRIEAQVEAAVRAASAASTPPASQP